MTELLAGLGSVSMLVSRPGRITTATALPSLSTFIFTSAPLIWDVPFGRDSNRWDLDYKSPDGRDDSRVSLSNTDQRLIR